jgi:glutathione S-transferase
MRELFHQSLSPASRIVRLALAEKRLDAAATVERFWERRAAFLALNPAGSVPVFVDNGIVVSGAYHIPEYLEEAYPDPALWPSDAAERREARRLLDWFLTVFQSEVTEPLLMQKINPRFCGSPQPPRPGGPDINAIRGGIEAIRRHLDLIGHLSDTRRWLAGETLSYADLAAAAQLSCIDYAGDVPWSHNEQAKTWYMRIKSRPSFRPLLAETIPGVPPARHYAVLDF